MKRRVVITKIVLIILFIACLFDWNYGFYQMVRFLGMLGFLFLGINTYNKINTSNIWVITWMVSALLINPFFKVALGRFLWNIVDVIWALLLIISIFLESDEKE